MSERRMILREYEDAIDDPSMNSQPIEVYLYYAAIEREREANDPRPIPDASWTVVFKRLIGRGETAVVAPKIDPLRNARRRGGGIKAMFRAMVEKEPADGAAETSRPAPATIDEKVPASESETGDATAMAMGVPTLAQDQRAATTADTTVALASPDEKHMDGSFSPVSPISPISPHVESNEDFSHGHAHDHSSGNLLARNSKGSSQDRHVEAGSLLTPEESQTAYRMLRAASWQVVFFLITTDVIGWFSTPMAFSLLGFGPGVLVYTAFYLLAFCGGQVLWRLYLSLDSERYPVKCYADIGHRTFGTWVQHLFNGLQSVQLAFSVGMLLVLNGQALAQIIDFKFCYLALTIFFGIFCMLLAIRKTVRGLAWMTNVNVFINVIVMTLTMVGIGIYDPVPAQSGHADLSEPVRTSGWVPKGGLGWYQQVQGVQLAVFSYGGAMLFIEFMAEMRRPRDFWKAAFCAQTLCAAMYQLFGIFVYAMQGQYTAILPTVNMSSILFQGLTNILGLIIICSTCTLYAHIGCKVFYRSVMRGYFGAPSLMTARSTLWWWGTVAGYFVVSWAIGSAIPNINDLATIVSAVCIMQFTYTFPPLLLVGHWVQRDALAGDAKWEPGVAPWTNRVDTWKDASRWRRGFARYWYLKVSLVLVGLGCLTLCVLGLYSGIMSAKASYVNGYSTAYSCRAPGQPA